jgi:hypothetical protein
VEILEEKERVDEKGGVTMTGMLVGGTETRGRQRSVRWVLQALIVVAGLGQPALWVLLSTVVPLALDSPLRVLVSGRGRLVALPLRVLVLSALAIGQLHLQIGFTAMFGAMLAAVLQTGLVFVVAAVLSRSPISPLRAPRAS